jgi:microcystin-dependent protein
MGFLSLQSITPPGVILPFAGSLAPNGWILCQGQAVSRPISAGGSTDTYKALYAAIGTTYGAGDGSTTFNLPNTQGYFLRGAGTTGIYSTTRGNVQEDQFQGHHHNVKTANGNQVGRTSAFSGGSNQGMDLNGLQTNLEAHEPLTRPANGNVRYGAETRPANIGVNYIIKI